MTVASRTAFSSEQSSQSYSYAPLQERAKKTMSTLPRPFLRWPGSKRRVLSEIIPFLPAQFNRYYEPFLGGGSLFFLLQPSLASLGDTCDPLISCFRTVGDHPSHVWNALHQWPVDRASYYEVRALVATSEVEAAAKFIYLNKTAWNGLYRVNSRGEYNVPFGRPKSSRMVDPEHLLSCSQVLRQSGVRLTTQDFMAHAQMAAPGDLVYFDPPYAGASPSCGFVDYNQTLFSWSDQRRLSELAYDLVARGVHVVMSNIDNDAVIREFSFLRNKVVHRSSTLAGDRNARRRVSERIFTSVSLDCTIVRTDS